MIEVILVIVIGILVGLLAYDGHEHRLERSKMFNLLMAKNNQEAVQLTVADQTKVNIEPLQQEETPDLVNINEASDDEFNKFIKSQT